MKILLYIAFGGALGSVIRYLSGLYLGKWFVFSFPVATFLINVLGSLLIGILFGLLQKFPEHQSELKYMLMIGFCGGFTTFSAFSLENYHLLQNQQYFLLFLYAFLSVFVGLLAVILGIYLVK